MNKIAIFLFVKNEIDFIEKWLSHNTRVADETTVIDNGSTDGTLEILKSAGDDVRLIKDHSHFGRKGRICTHWMLKSDADILVPLDADELVVFDDGTKINPDPAKAKEYLKGMPVNKNDRFQIRRIYMRHPEEDGWWESCRSNKRIMARAGLKGVDAGFHGGHMEDNQKPIPCNISYLHYHFRNKEAWLKSTEQKLKARLGDRWDDLEFLKTYRKASHHVGKELIRYKKKGVWHSVKKHIFNQELGRA